MPPNFFQKPETALKRAQELISVGKEVDALETLHDTIKSKRHKQWTKTHELIMLKHVELCVMLRRPHMAKDALFQYKTLTQQIAVKSLETVILRFLELAQQKTEEAQKTSIEKVEEIDDLDQADAPENLLLSAVSGAAAQDRMDRTVLSPWLRFLWDSYRNCLDLLRNNAVVEQLYHRIARQSFEFCAKYQRRTEFRKLCDHLRMHLSQIQKHQHLAHVVKLSSAESLMLMQDTRLIQLDTAIQMELWQEAYRSAEDVHGMMQLSKDKDKRMVKPASYVNYFDKLALVFWKAGNRLFHAAALLQKFIIHKDMKKTFSSEEATDQATRVLLATLSIPDGADKPSDLTRHLDIEEQHIANMRLLSNLLRLPIAPSRAGILKEIGRLNIPEIAIENARNLYHQLECHFAPLRLASQVELQLKKIMALEKSDYKQYVDALRGVTATKVVKQVSLIYDTLSMERVRKVIPFYNEIELERFLVDISKHRYVKAQIDHREKCVHFGAVDATLEGALDNGSSNTFNGDSSQVGVEGIRGHLELMYRSLRDVVNILDADEHKKAGLEHLKRHAEIYAFHKNTDYERILLRRKKIENYKETSERLKLEKSQQALAEANRREEQRRAEEMRRLELENIEKEKMRKQAEQEEIERRVRAEKMKKIQATPIYQAIVKDHGEEAFQNMDPDSVLREQRDRMDEQRREQQARLQMQEKKFDHMVRAYHLEEMKARQAIAEQYARMAPIRHAEYEKRRIETAVGEHARAIATYERMQRVRADAMVFLEEVKNAHQDDFAQRMAEWEEKLREEREKRLAERHELRKEARRKEWKAERERQIARAKEAAEQARREEIEKERRAAREAARPPKREPVESIADADVDWRRGAQPTAPRQPAAIQRPPLAERIMEGERPRERVPMPPSEADSGPWRRGQVVSGHTAPSAFAERENITAAPRHIEREQPHANEADAGPWRRGQVITSIHREPPQGMARSGIGERRGEPSGAPAHEIGRPSAPIGASSPADAGSWRRGMIVTRTAGDGGEMQHSSAMSTPSNQPWRPKRQLEAASASQLSNGPAQMRIFDGATTGSLSQQSSDGGGSKWTAVPMRGADGVSVCHSRGLSRRDVQQQHKTADDDRNWRKK
uniref:Eukaryotic translation initiation factor 3 subunit A n=2 Tax=Ascarididae TaxID=6250 RepID=A0A914ZX12_PARUN